MQQSLITCFLREKSSTEPLSASTSTQRSSNKRTPEYIVNELLEKAISVFKKADNIYLKEEKTIIEASKIPN